MRRRASAIDTALPIEGQKFMAWSGLLKWAQAVVVQADRIAEAKSARILVGSLDRVSPVLAQQREMHFLYCGE